MTAIINGDSPSITFSDSTTQATSAVVSGKVPKSLLPSGSVLQVVQGTYATANTTTSTSFIDTNLSIAITPTSSTSKVLIMAIHGDAGASSTANGMKLILVRNSSPIGSNFSTNVPYLGTVGAGFAIISSQTIVYLDSPATTSSVTYKTQFASQTGGGVTLFRDNTQGVIIAMEIAA